MSNLAPLKVSWAAAVAAPTFPAKASDNMETERLDLPDYRRSVGGRAPARSLPAVVVRSLLSMIIERKSPGGGRRRIHGP